jgi:catalase
VPQITNKCTDVQGTDAQFADSIVQQGYLAQQYAISPDYAQAIYNALPADKRGDYTMAQVSRGGCPKPAHMKGKNLSFNSKDGRGFMGMSVPTSQ